MAVEYERALADLDKALADPNVADSVADILLDIVKARMPGSGTVSTLAAADIPAAVPSSASATTTGIIVEDGTTGTPNVITLATDASAETFGAWTEIDASVSANSWIDCITIGKDGVSAVDNCVIEIGTGAAASEVTKIRKSFGSAIVDINITIPLSIPIKVASGTRIAARASNKAANSISLYTGLSMYQSLET